jgi:phosphopantothenate synthetase
MAIAMPENDQREIYVAMGRAFERFDTAVGDKAEAWANEASAVEAPVKLITAQAPVAA